MADEKKAAASTHRIMMDDREKISICGVEEVLTFDEETIMIETSMGMLTIKGINLHVNKLNLEKTELEVDGEIESLIYSDGDTYGKPGKSLFSKIFR